MMNGMFFLPNWLHYLVSFSGLGGMRLSIITKCLFIKLRYVNKQMVLFILYFTAMNRTFCQNKQILFRCILLPTVVMFSTTVATK